MKGRISLVLAALLATGLATAAAELASAQTPLSSCGNVGTGSYVLTRNLTATGHCWTLTSSHITLDLNGFTITGDGGSADYGIRAGIVINPNPSAIKIRNGTITNFGRAIYLFNRDGVVVERVHALRNTERGIWLGNDCVLKDNVAAANAIQGLIGGRSCLATGNNASFNSGNGLSVGAGSTIIGNVAENNESNGISASPGSTFANNSSFGNDVYGILAACPSNVVGNTAVNNVGNNIQFSGAGCGNSHNVAP